MFLIYFIYAYSNIDSQPMAKNNFSPTKIKVVTTLFPLYDFARFIGGKNAEVTLLLPPGMEAHSFDPKPGDIAKINSADVFVYIGKEMEPWAEDLLDGLNNYRLKVVVASEGINFLQDENEDFEHENYGTDPHIWLDFENAKKMAANITETLVKTDEDNREYYEGRLEELQNNLIALDDRYKNELANCQNKKIIYGGHYAFGYLAKRYGLTYKATQGFVPESEPTANDLAILIKQIKDEKIETIFYEELSSPKIAQTLGRETNAKLLMLNAAHNVSREDLQTGKTFINIMEENLNNLKYGLKCQ